MKTTNLENGKGKSNQDSGVKVPAFVNGNPVNSVSVSKEAENEQAKQTDPVAEPAKKLTLDLDQTLKLVADLAKKTALRDRYIGYLDALDGFEKAQSEQVDELEDETAFQQCELTITDQKGNVFNTKSPSVIRETVGFISGRFAERLAEVEAGIVLQA